MGSSCCENKCDDLKILAKKQKTVLWIVLILNGLMFFVEYILGYLASSQALMADSLDMLGDAFAYASSLYVVEKSLSAKVKASKFKASLMLILAASVFYKVIERIMHPEIPQSFTMTWVGGVALIINLVCLFLLTKHKDDDINFTSVWICSRNDIIANTSVLIAAGLVYYFNSSIPDLVVGLGITFLFTKSALGIFKQANLS